MDMSVGRLTGMRGERRTKVQGGVIAGSVAGACVIAVPVGLWELAFSSIGLSEFVPVLAPPVGWPVRIVLALVAAVVAALFSGTGRDGDPAEGRGAGRQGTTIMGWTQSLGLHHLARLARGGAEAVDNRVVITPAMRMPRARRSPQEKVQESLARRRADMHPDAPPRAPLMASRDLPVVTELTVVETAPEQAFGPQPLPPIATPIRDTTDKVRPRPLPRAPEPLSDTDLNWVRDLLQSDGDNIAPVSTAPLSSILPEMRAADISADDSLLSMLGRFEQGVAQRIAVRDSADAQTRIEESIVAAVQPPVSVAPAPTEDMGVDEALNAALETLKKLSAKANGR